MVRDAGVAVDVIPTSGPGHAVQLSRAFAAQGYDRVVVWGGDGTINEVAGPLIHSQTILGIVPGESGDGLAHSLGLPRDVAAAGRAALTGPACGVDVGYFGRAALSQRRRGRVRRGGSRPIQPPQHAGRPRLHQRVPQGRLVLPMRDLRRDDRG